jgi:aspartyl-tRNA(Asn)/glutamyl-tRNA(Gln) amidotransferase subunit A
MPAIGNDVFFAGIRELNRNLLSRQFSAVELTRAFATRLEQLGPRYNALALSLSKQALRKAGEVDSELKRGRTRGMLQGIPYGVKDLLSVAGAPTTWGARPFAAQVFDYTATVIEKLESAGAPLAGKLSMVQLAGGGGYRYAAASLTGPGLNPWDRTRWAGGSSSGPAAAVAAGLVPFAIGSETSGSIITPAAYCGVTALRPTYGLVSRYGAMALSWTLDKLGPFARNAEDCGFILQAIAGGDANDPGSAGKRFYYTPQYARPLKDLKIGYAPVDIAERADEAARPAFQAVIEALKASGARMVEVRLPAWPYSQTLSTILYAEMASIFEPLVSSGKVEELADQAQIAGLKASMEIAAKDYLKAMRLRRLMQRDLAALFTRVDVLAAPARTGPATPIEQALTPLPGAAQQAPARIADPGFAPLIQAGNLAGLPALALPCGFAQGLPVGLQLVGPPFSENALLALGNDYQSKTDWHKRRPRDL